MRWKKVVVMMLCITLVSPFLRVNIEVSAESYESMDTITLKESPYSLGEGWTLDSSYSSNAPYSLAIGNKEYVAVGPYGTVMKSKDGRNWKALSKFGNYQLTTIAWDGSKYLMFGANAEYEREAQYVASEAFVSTDGLQWKKIAFKPGEAIHYLAWGKGKFVAVGRKNVFTSADGENWTRTLSLGDHYGSHPISYVNGTFFIFGSQENKMYTSKDGLKWTTGPRDTKAGINDLVWVKDHYLGVGKGVYTSKDGLKWSKQSKLPSNVELQSIFTNGKTFIAVGYGSGRQISYTSNDGVTWKQHDLSNLQVMVYTMYPVAGGFAGFGSYDEENHPDGTYSIFTSDGAKWSYQLAGTSRSGDFTGLATNGKRTVAVGHQGSVIYTDNGTQWKSANPFSYRDGIGRVSLFDVAWGANKFVAVGNHGVYVSSDGVSWKQAKVTFKDKYGDLSQILWTGKFFVASDQVYGVYTSKDGLAWTKVSSVSQSDYWLNSMVWDGKRVLAAFQIYNNGKQYIKIMQSTNGTTWTTLANLSVMEAHLAWNGERYLVVDPYDATKMWVSKDGKTWSKAAVNLDKQDRFEFITSYQGYFFAFNDSIREVNGDYEIYHAYYVSKDGVKWKEVPVPDRYPDFEINGNEMMLDGIKAHGKYIFVGAYGQIMYTNGIKF